MLINVESTEYVSYSKAYFGAAILIHGTQDFPQGADKATVGQPGMDVTIAVIPSVVVSEKSIRELALNQRNCYFDDEVIFAKNAWNIIRFDQFVLDKAKNYKQIHLPVLHFGMRSRYDSGHL